MDMATISRLTSTTVEGGGGGGSFLDSIGGMLGGFATAYGNAYLDEKFDVSGRAAERENALQEQSLAFQSQQLMAGVSMQQVVIVVGGLVAAVVLYKVLA